MKLYLLGFVFLKKANFCNLRAFGEPKALPRDAIPRDLEASSLWVKGQFAKIHA